VISDPNPRRGEVWQANLDPVVGPEQTKIRPVLVVSNDGFNSLANQLCVVVPLTGTDRGLPYHVRVQPPEGGLDRLSIVQCEQITVRSYERLLRRRGRVDPATLRAVEARLRRLLAL
jgi:mRNA interferase MazF